MKLYNICMKFSTAAWICVCKECRLPLQDKEAKEKRPSRKKQKPQVLYLRPCNKKRGEENEKDI